MARDNDRAFEPSISQVRRIYEVAFGNIQRTLEENNMALTEWNRARIEVIETQVSTILRDLNSNVNDASKLLVQTAYENGLIQTEDAAGSGGRVSFNRVDQPKINSIAQEMSRNLTDSIAEIGRWVDDGLRRAQLDSLAMAQAQGLSQREQKAKLLDYMRVENLSMPKGYRGKLAQYVEMVTRTNLAEANRSARLYRGLSLGYTLFQVKGHADACPTCKPWNDSIISMVPNSDGVPVFNEIRENRRTHLFGPNCNHQRLRPVTDTLFSEEEIEAGIEKAKAAWALYS